MSTAQRRHKIKKAVDRVPTDRLASLEDYVKFLNQPTLPQRLAAAQRGIARGKGVNWRKVRKDV